MEPGPTFCRTIEKEGVVPSYLLSDLVTENQGASPFTCDQEFESRPVRFPPTRASPLFWKRPPPVYHLTLSIPRPPEYDFVFPCLPWVAFPVSISLFLTRYFDNSNRTGRSDVYAVFIPHLEFFPVSASSQRIFIDGSLASS